jgi:hypothetical protein
MHTQDGTYTTYSRKDINPLCECGKESQDTVHLYKCVDEIYGNTKSMDAKGNHDINSILNYFNLPPIAGMMAERKEEYRRVYDAKEAERGHAREGLDAARRARPCKVRSQRPERPPYNNFRALTLA